MNNPFSDIFNSAAGQYGVDPNWLTALGQWESGFNPNAVSSAGATGVMQIMPFNNQSLGITDSTDPYQNIMGGANLFSQYLNRANGDYPTATMWYNCGPNNTCPAGQKEAAGVQSIYNNIIQGSGNATPTSTASGTGSNTSSNCNWYDLRCNLNSAADSIDKFAGTGQYAGKSGVTQWVSRISIIILGLILLAGAVYLYKQ